MAARRPRWGPAGRTTAVIGLVLAGTLAGAATGAFMLEPEDPPPVPVIKVSQPPAADGREDRGGERREPHRAPERGERKRRRGERRKPKVAEHAPAPGDPVPLPPAPPAAVAVPTPEPVPQPAAPPAPAPAPSPPADDDQEEPDDDAGAGDD